MNISDREYFPLFVSKRYRNQGSNVLRRQTFMTVNRARPLSNINGLKTLRNGELSEMQ
jgi:hypothetical protein